MITIFFLEENFMKPKVSRYYIRTHTIYYASDIKNITNYVIFHVANKLLPWRRNYSLYMSISSYTEYLQYDYYLSCYKENSIL